MKKHLIILIAIIFLVGCTRVDNIKFDDISKMVIKENNKVNRNYQGYSFYLPKDYKMISKENSSFTLKLDDHYVYMYIDVLGYYYNEPLDYVKSLDSVYSKEFSNGKIKGYLEIRNLDKNKNDYYYIIVYNYTKIEGITSKDKVINDLVNASYILSSVKYNKVSIKSQLDEELKTKEKYNMFDNKEKDDTNYKSEEVIIDKISELKKNDEGIFKNKKEGRLEVNDEIIR